MSKECFVCVEPASEQYTLILPDGEVFEEKTVCDGCVADLRDTAWLKVIAGPVVMRGERNQQDTEKK